MIILVLYWKYTQFTHYKQCLFCDCRRCRCCSFFWLRFTSLREIGMPKYLRNPIAHPIQKQWGWWKKKCAACVSAHKKRAMIWNKYIRVCLCMDILFSHFCHNFVSFSLSRFSSFFLGTSPFACKPKNMCTTLLWCALDKESSAVQQQQK